MLQLRSNVMHTCKPLVALNTTINLALNAKDPFGSNNVHRRCLGNKSPHSNFNKNIELFNHSNTPFNIFSSLSKWCRFNFITSERCRVSSRQRVMNGVVIWWMLFWARVTIWLVRAGGTWDMEWHKFEGNNDTKAGDVVGDSKSWEFGRWNNRVQRSQKNLWGSVLIWRWVSLGNLRYVSLWDTRIWECGNCKVGTCGTLEESNHKVGGR